MKLHWKILIGLALGIVVAFISSSLGFSKFIIQWIDPFGTIFIKLLKLLAVPLVLFSIIKGVAVIAVSVGLFLVNTIQPGTKFSPEEKLALRKK